MITSPSQIRFIRIRSICMIGVDVGLAYGLAYVEVSVSTVLIYLFPIVIIFEAKCFLKENITKLDYLCTGLSFLGLLFVVRQPAAVFGEKEEDVERNGTYYGMLLVLVGVAVLFGTQIVAQRAVRSCLNFFLMNYYYSVGMSVLIGALLYFVEVESHNGALDLLKMFGCHMAQIIAIMSQYYALKFEQAGRGIFVFFLVFSGFLVGIICYAQVLLTFLGEIFVMGVDADAFGIIGAVLIVGSSFSIGIYKMCQERIEAREAFRKAQLHEKYETAQTDNFATEIPIQIPSKK